ncbi:MAG: PH domain-containing protein [Wenzhouxiangellaceae bacterium]|nr:PH domain-containing protein [Wenzhouxiangellaceae bacterium]
MAATFRRYTLVSTAFFGLLAAAIALTVLLVLVPDLPLPLPLAAGAVVLPAAAVSAIVATYRWVDAGFRGWALRDHDQIARSGIFWRRVTVLPVARIQHVETAHGPLERFFGLARLKLFTAGGVTADLVVIGLERGTADRLREYLVEQIRMRDDRAQVDERG